MATGRSVGKVARDSYALSLYTFLQIEDARRLENLKTEWYRIESAGLTAIAFHEPKKLESAIDDYKRKLFMVPTRKEAIERAAKLFAEVPQKRRRKRRR